MAWLRRPHRSQAWETVDELDRQPLYVLLGASWFLESMGCVVPCLLADYLRRIRLIPRGREQDLVWTKVTQTSLWYRLYCSQD